MPAPTRRPNAQTRPFVWSAEAITALGLAALLPSILASGFTSYEVLKGGLLMVACAPVLVSWALRAFTGGRVQIRGAMIVFALAALSLIATGSALWAQSAPQALLASGHWLAMLTLVLIALEPASRKVRPGDLAAALGVGVSVASVLGLLQAFGVDLGLASPGSVTDGLRGSFDHERTGAIALACAVPMLAAGVATLGHHRPRQLMAGAGLALGALYLGVVETSLPYAVILGGGGFAAVMFAAARGKAAWASLKRPVIACIVALGLIGVGNVLERSDSTTNAAQARAKILALPGVDVDGTKVATSASDWGRPTPPIDQEGHAFAVSTGMNVFGAHPVFGVGSGNFDRVSMGHMDIAQPYYKRVIDPYPLFRSAHNSYVQLLAELGVVGLALWLLALALTLLLTWRSLRIGHGKDRSDHPETWAYVFGALGTLAAVSVAAWFDVAFHNATSGLLAALALGLLIRSATDRLSNVGLARTWKLGEGSLGAFERVAMAGVLPLAGVALLAFAAWASLTSDFYKARGDVWLKAGFMDKATEAYEHALGIPADNALAHLNKAHIDLARLPRDKAEPILAEGLAQRPFDARYHASLGELRIRLAKVKGQEALKKLNETLNPNEPPNAEQTAQITQEFDAETLDKAISNLKRAIDLHPRNLRSYKLLSNAGSIKRDLELSSGALDDALDALPDLAPTHRIDLFVVLGKLHASNEKWEQALKHLNAAKALGPKGRRGRLLDMEIARVTAMRDGKPLPSAHDHGGGHGHGHGPGPGHSMNPPGKGPAGLPPGLIPPGVKMPTNPRDLHERLKRGAHPSGDKKHGKDHREDAHDKAHREGKDHDHPELHRGKEAPKKP